MEGSVPQRAATLAMLRQLERKVLWLSSYMIHHANHEVDRGDGLKVGGHQASSASLAAIMTAAGHEPVLLPTAGGSLPMDLFQQGNNVPVIAFPIVNHDNNQHAANENLRLQNLWDALEVFAAFFSGLETSSR